jgi:hypothetical protein
VVGAVLAVWLLTRGAPSALADLDPEPVPVSAPVSTATLDHAADATLTAAVDDGPQVLATALTGTVTRVDVAPGTTLDTGGAVYAVDGVPVIAYADESVIYRPLQRGDTGADVAAAQRVLSVVLGVDTGAEGTFGATTERAVRAYERRIGVATPTGVLDPAWFARLPAAPFVVASVEIQPGQPAPAAGEPVATATGTASAVTVLTDSTGPAGTYRLTTPDGAIAVTHAVDGTWQVDDPAAAGLLVTGSGEVLDGTATLTGRLRLSPGEDGQSLPGAAVVTDALGGTCVVTSDDRQAVRVEILGSTADGLAQIRPTLPADATVLLDPLTTLGDLTCPAA